MRCSTSHHVTRSSTKCSPRFLRRKYSKWSSTCATVARSLLGVHTDVAQMLLPVQVVQPAQVVLAQTLAHVAVKPALLALTTTGPSPRTSDPPYYFKFKSTLRLCHAMRCAAGTHSTSSSSESPNGSSPRASAHSARAHFSSAIAWKCDSSQLRRPKMSLDAALPSLELAIVFCFVLFIVRIVLVI